ncbi:MAG: HAMP domain-containing histidine kinase [Betaproteobacteria bacterium]|nr:HAMP domain-containing histidine kinase [Betaproteobacteria bacterium]
MRSPVAALALQVQLARSAQSEEARGTALQELESGIERARRLVQQLLDFARLEPGVRSEPFASVDLARLAREAVGAASARAEELGIDLGAEAKGTTTVAGSESDLRSLIENLVDNALRYSPREGAVTVSVERRDGTVELSVVDAGPGIPPAERERVFERFHRVAGDTTRGSGLGLAIVKAIVERHRANIELADANPGANPPGLAARIRFPATQLGKHLLNGVRNTPRVLPRPTT